MGRGAGQHLRQSSMVAKPEAWILPGKRTMLVALVPAIAALVPTPTAPRSGPRLSQAARCHTPRLDQPLPARSASPHSASRSALVVGAGPAGLAAAYVLAQRGWEVEVLERRREASLFEAQKAYLYLVDGRGQAFTDAAGLTDELAAISVPSTNYTVTRCMPDGERVEAVPPVLTEKGDDKPAYWVPRQVLIELFCRRLASLGPSVTTTFGASVSEISRTADGGVEVLVHGVDGADGGRSIRPTLLVGADGLGSCVRQRCSDWAGSDPSLGATASDFTPVQLPSASTGLRYKMLRLPPDFRLSRDEPSVRAQPRKAYSVRCTGRPPLGPCRLGLLPVSDPEYPRTANVILPPEHPVWTELRSGPQVLEWLQQTFPQLPVADIVSEDEAAEFASIEAGAFPAPCYVPRQHLLLPRAAVALVGDAVHAFPPDIGQGVNAALKDVMHLADAFDTVDADAAAARREGEHAEADAGDEAMPLLRAVLPEYGRTCAPEAEAVARLAQIGFPYQYNNGGAVVRALWFANFAARTFVLSKLAPALFSPAAVVMVLRPNLGYSEIWARASATTRRLRALGALGVLGAVWWSPLGRLVTRALGAVCAAAAGLAFPAFP